MKDNLPIVYVLDASIAVTGAFVSARTFAQALANDARIVLVLPIDHAIPASELHGFWRVETIPLVNLSKRYGALLAYFPALLRGAWKLRQLMKRDGAQRLQLNDFFLLQGAVLRVLGYRGHIVSWVRCDPVRFAGPLTRIILSLTHQSANRMVAVSNHIRNLLPKHYNVEVLYNFYTGPIRAPRVWGKEEKKSIAYVGNYIPGKGQDMALRAFTIAAAQDATLHLDFYGSELGLQKNRDYLENLKVTAQQLGIASRVTFHGFMQGTYSILENAFAALNCSVSESFSRTVLEASGAGVAVIATLSGGPQEIIKEGVTGYLIPVGDFTAAADRIMRLANDPERASTMGQAGAIHIKEQFCERKFKDFLTTALHL